MKTYAKIREAMSLLSHPWVFCCFSILFLGLGTLLGENGGGEFPTLFLVVTSLMSFPSGLVTFLFAWPLIDINPTANFVLVWVLVFLVGYFQWFHIVSNLRGGPVTLSLSNVESIAAESEVKLSSPKEKPKIRKGEGPIVHFDSAGRSPLERVLQAGSRKNQSLPRL